VSAFANEPVLELRREPNRAALIGALRTLDAAPPLGVPVLVGSDAGADTGIDSYDPGAPQRLVATAGIATPADVADAVERARAGQRAWAARTPDDRAGALHRAAQVLRMDRVALAALQVRECGKPWAEADADVCEAIDHIEYAAAQAVELARGRELLQLPGERNTLRYRPRGVVAAIAPWNFPLAIPAGLVATGLATGNAVILKPAEQAPASGYRLVEALRRGGVPPDVMQLLPGFGETGAALVAHPGVHIIAFTGSEGVGLAIIRAAAETLDGQPHVKRVVAEMGGKNAIIVDSDADLDEALVYIIDSAFGYQGQKCSAASRVILVEEIHDQLLERLVGAVKSLKIGPPEDPRGFIGPVIDAAAHSRIAGYIDLGKREGRCVVEREAPAGGYFVGPAIFSEIEAHHRLAQEEIFGPVLAVLKARDFDHALEIASRASYALTGGLFSRSPAHVEKARREFRVGNLYINRGITGAIVERQPFGGLKLSGIGSKAGGPDYLLQFLEPRTISENTLRHGFMPPEKLRNS
jgi:RHH-type proline utilization regulon transcriptional repressor/proline dehydrogenase/delta 1-pyrroline-5-carboxylate dehydrogenase